jgi:hypothetical protein
VCLNDEIDRGSHCDYSHILSNIVYHSTCFASKLNTPHSVLDRWFFKALAKYIRWFVTLLLRLSGGACIDGD